MKNRTINIDDVEYDVCYDGVHDVRIITVECYDSNVNIKYHLRPEVLGPIKEALQPSTLFQKAEDIYQDYAGKLNALSDEQNRQIKMITDRLEKLEKCRDVVIKFPDSIHIPE